MVKITVTNPHFDIYGNARRNENCNDHQNATRQTTTFVNLMSKMANIYSISQGYHLYGCHADKKSYNCDLRCVCVEASSCPTFG